MADGLLYRGMALLAIFILFNLTSGVTAQKFKKSANREAGRNKNAVIDQVQRMRQMTWHSPLVQPNIQNDSIKEVSCDMFPNHVPNSINTYESVGCKPRKAIVSINSPITLYQVAHLHPTHVEVDRCSGMCASDPYATKSCMPTGIKIIEIPVTSVVMKSPNETSAQCFLVKIEEHLKCDCDCSIKEKHCHQTKHFYNKRHCRCECKNESQSSKCREDKVWDPVTCSCECARELSCSTGYLFHPEYCTCVKITMKKMNKKPLKAAKFERKVFKRS